MRTSLIAVVGSLLLASAASAADAPTFYKDVLPILQANCQTCHRPGEVAPMSLLTYEQARPWARAIKNAVVSKQMPPWFADPGYAHLSNERRLVEREIDTLAAWADNGAPAGDPSDGAACAEVRERLEHHTRRHRRDAEAVRRSRARHDQLQVHRRQRKVHRGHVGVGGRDAARRPRRPASRQGVGASARDRSGWRRPCPGRRTSARVTRDIIGNNAIEEGNDILGKFNPGLGAQRFDINGAAKFVPKGSDLVFELHYTTSGKPAPDISKLGLVLAKEPPQTRYFFHAGPTALNLAIPPGDGKAEVVSEITFGENARLVYAQPHMHLRGKDFELRVVSPDGSVDDGAEGQLELRMADGLSVRRADRHAEGCEAAAGQPLRQLDGQPLQSRSRRRRSCGVRRTGTR